MHNGYMPLVATFEHWNSGTDIFMKLTKEQLLEIDGKIQNLVKQVSRRLFEREVLSKLFFEKTFWEHITPS